MIVHFTRKNQWIDGNQKHVHRLLGILQMRSHYPKKQHQWLGYWQRVGHQSHLKFKKLSLIKKKLVNVERYDTLASIATFFTSTDLVSNHTTPAGVCNITFMLVYNWNKYFLKVIGRRTLKLFNRIWIYYYNCSPLKKYKRHLNYLQLMYPIQQCLQ